MYDVMAKRDGDMIIVLFPEALLTKQGARPVIQVLNATCNHFNGNSDFYIISSKLVDSPTLGEMHYRVYWLKG